MTPGKRALDIGLALFLAVILAPVIAAIAIMVLRGRDGPVLYGSERMRSPAEGFTLWKFRTMAPAAGDQGVTGGDKTNRITPLGAKLRRARLDELPQLWNILRGDISFVGPRPPLRRYVEMCPDLYARVLRSRPGVTGLASLVYAAHEERILAACRTGAETEAAYVRRCVPRKAALDLIYQRNRTIWLDVKLIAWTTARFIPRRWRPERKGRPL
ncbi:sugar transferase [Jannaschia formosa]|uniref:sugar transferase n=1 Tax=Jannaschia formosa TaxID=2259592 RepID=UPI000E1BD114|nr:sugar transferase [Jannaschia formosa]TFL18043.1 sugar transferase [Jannaschia formosa]